MHFGSAILIHSLEIGMSILGCKQARMLNSKGHQMQPAVFFFFFYLFINLCILLCSAVSVSPSPFHQSYHILSLTNSDPG